MEDARRHLAELLTRIEGSPRDHEARVQAATLAVRLCLESGEVRLADVAEALAVDLPAPMPPALEAEVHHQAAVARAARRAVALANARGLRSPRALANAMVAEAERLADDVRRRILANQLPIARAVLEVALARFPEDPVLHSLAPLVRRPVNP